MIRGPGFRFGAMFARSRSIPTPAKRTLFATPPSTTSAARSNPLILHGQTHAGLRRGIGQALWEHAYYDAATGQLLSGSLQDYAMPSCRPAAVLHHRIERNIGARQSASACAPEAKAAPPRRLESS